MSRFRKIDVRIWADAKFMRLSVPPPNGQTLWLYLLTNPETTCIPGLFRAGEAQMAEALGWPLEDFREAFQEAASQGMVEADWKARLVWIPNAIHHNAPENPNVVKSWGKMAWDELPECELKGKAHQALASFFAPRPGLSEAFLKAFRQACPHPSAKTYPNQEQEQEQDLEALTGADAPPTPAQKVLSVVDPTPPDLVDAMREDWNRLVPATCPRWQQTPKARRTAALARLREHKGDLQPLAWWRDMLAKVARSSYLRGEKTDWRATPDWLLKPANAAKVLEGNYDDRVTILRQDTPEAAAPAPEPTPDPIPDDLEPVDAEAMRKLIVGVGKGEEYATGMLSRVRPAGRRGDTVFLLVGDKFYRDFIDDHFGEALRQRFADELGAESIKWLCNAKAAGASAAQGVA